MDAVTPIHTSVAGRARFHVAALYRSPAVKYKLEGRLSRRNGIRSVSANVVTGNILVLYNADQSIEHIRRTIEELLSVSANGRNSGQQEVAEQPWHSLATDAVPVLLGSSPDTGLTRELSRQRLLEYGPNVLHPHEARSRLSIFLDQFKSLPVALLLGSAAFSLATGGVADAVIIGAVVLLNAGIGGTIESQAEHTVTTLLDTREPLATVMREGVVTRIPAEEVVPGDILVLARGEEIPADARILEARNLSVDESALTGESLPAEKTAAPLSEDTVLAERRNMVYRGSIATGGSGLAVVVATGLSTQLGRIQLMIAQAVRPQTPLQRRLHSLSHQMLSFSAVVCGGVLAAGLIRGYPGIQMIRAAISLAVAAIPEGLPAIATTALASGLRNLLPHKVILRRLDALETLGCVQVVCLDKTGTLTMNRMSVARVFTGGRSYVVGTDGFLSNGEDLTSTDHEDLMLLIQMAALCNEAGFVEQDGGFEVEGSPTEAALLELAVSRGINPVELRRNYERISLEQRTESRNYMKTIHRRPGGGRLIAVKGNPDEVLALCTGYRKNGAVVRLSARQRREIEIENTRMAHATLRVLGVAYGESDREGSLSEEGLIWLGLIGMTDPTREGLRELITELRRAGVRPVMITGDQRSTAEAIAESIGIRADNSYRTLSGTEIESMEESAMDAAVARTDVFARVSPSYKLKLIQSFQRSGKVVAMTGDGINDGPALRAADIGITLGKTGTRVARETAHFVLRDDNLGTLIPALREGRRVHENIRRAVHYIATTNVSEILMMFTSLASGLGQPLNHRQLLWINLLTDVLPQIALALQTAEDDLMARPPSDPQAKIIEREDLWRLAQQSVFLTAGGLLAYIYGVGRYGIGPRASSTGFLALTSAQLLHAITARSRHSVFEGKRLPPNPYLFLSMGAGFGMMLLACSVPVFRNMLGLAGVSPADLGVAASSAIAALLANECAKPLHRRQRPLALPAPSGNRLTTLPSTTVDVMG
ncbi:MAG: cation-transporting P-type ATPase [Bryobacteraceae bacterium]|nr:cation-transporting P-type ATPase [Bryobacteraceae bacterium]